MKELIIIAMLIGFGMFVVDAFHKASASHPSEDTAVIADWNARILRGDFSLLILEKHIVTAQ